MSEEINKEKISKNDLITNSALSVHLNNTLHSKEFINAMKRITYHFNVEEETSQTKVLQLQKFEFVVYEKLCSVFINQKNKCDVTNYDCPENRTICFLDFHHKLIYLSEKSAPKSVLIYLLCSKIFDFVGFKNAKIVSLLQSIFLLDDPKLIDQSLDTLGVSSLTLDLKNISITSLSGLSNDQIDLNPFLSFFQNERVAYLNQTNVFLPCTITSIQKKSSFVCDVDIVLDEGAIEMKTVSSSLIYKLRNPSQHNKIDQFLIDTTVPHYQKEIQTNIFQERYEKRLEEFLKKNK